MLYSIIIPYFNGYKTIDRCIESIYSQRIDSKKIEIIIIDDSSTDNISSKHADKLTNTHIGGGNNLKIIHHDYNRRQGGARNTGIRHARGEFLFFVDCDDVLLPNTLSKIITELEKNPDLDILMYDMLKSKNGVDEIMPYKSNHSKIVSGPDFFIQNEITYAVCLQAYKRDFLIGNNLFFQENMQFEDGDWSIEAILKASKVKYIPVMAYHYVINNSSTTSIKTAGKNITDAMESVKRMDNLYKKHSHNYEIKQKLYGHRIISAKSCSFRLIHVRNFKKTYSLINNYYKGRFIYSDGAYLWILSHFPLISASMIYLCSPILRRYIIAKQSH